jgi:hypothetical protein
MRPRGPSALVVAATLLVASPLLADDSPAAPAVRRPASRDVVLERVAARFWAPETGGAGHPRFIDDRTLAFEARLAAMAERSEGAGESYEERHVRDALDHAVGEELLASLAYKLLVELPATKRPSEADLARIQNDLGRASFDRLGGRARIDLAATAEGLDGADVEAILRRQALAAWYLDRSITPVLEPTEEQLREVFRTAAHPYRGQPYDAVRSALLRWLVVDLVRNAETAFLQTARARVKVVIAR